MGWKERETRWAGWTKIIAHHALARGEAMTLIYIVPAPGETTGSILNERGGIEAHVYANDPLGRQMAAAPELVEVVKRFVADRATLAAAFHAATGLVAPGEKAVDDVLGEDFRARSRSRWASWLSERAHELHEDALAVLKKAGVEP